MKILLSITGSVAAYKTPDLVRRLREAQHEVKVIVTEAAQAFVTTMALETIVPEGVFSVLMEPTMQHIQLAKWADVLLIAPASANTLAKLAQGQANDLLSATYLASQARCVIVPAMNQGMWQHSATQANVTILKDRGAIFWGPAQGLQMCGDQGPGRMLEPMEIVERLQTLNAPQLLAGKTILITAGPTHEAIDPVRFISNKSSGKMGYALAEAAVRMGAQVTLVTGPTELPKPCGVTLIPVITAAEMLAAVEEQMAQHSVFIAAAAVADYTVKEAAPHKIKKTQDPLTLTLTPTVDILKHVCQRPNKPLVIGFAAETHDAIAHGHAKRIAKGADWIIVNDVSRTDIGFNSFDNEVTLLSATYRKPLAKAPKTLLAEQILREIFTTPLQ